jgi:hypothetical protein
MVLPHDVEGSISIVSVMERERERESVVAIIIN